jgi:hypothetical protein
MWGELRTDYYEGIGLISHCILTSVKGKTSKNELVFLIKAAFRGIVMSVEPTTAP